MNLPHKRLRTAISIVTSLAVAAGLIGILVKDGRLDLSRPVGPALHWPERDARAVITIADLMAMSSGLRFNEGSGAVSDLTRMLYLEADMAAFASAMDP